MTTFWLQHAWLGAGPVLDGVLVSVAGSRFTSVEAGHASAPAGAESLAGLTIPGLANCHSHAFHRALRGHTQRERGTFWTWREQMYALAATLTPESYYELASAVYAEMAAVGITSVGEFHYVHHTHEGTSYDDPNAMGHALVAAARDAGIRIALLDTCYLSAGFGRAPEGVQRRFTDHSAAQWARRWEQLAAAYEGADDVVVGAAIHSVRAVPRAEIPVVVATAAGRPLHVHLSEQVAENADCQAAYGLTPTQLLADAGALTPMTSLVHATHLTDDDVRLIGEASAFSCFCPTTERDLGDGIGPSRALLAAGSPLTLGSDSHAVVDLFEEMRAVELDERLATQQRGHWSAEELLVAATSAGAASLGLGGGAIAPGGRADLVTVDLGSIRTAGSGPALETVVFAAGGPDVVHVLSGGRTVFQQADAPAIGARLAEALHHVRKVDA